MDSPTLTVRTIDDFLDQLCTGYKRRLPYLSIDIGMTSTNTPSGWHSFIKKIESGVKLILGTLRCFLPQKGCHRHSICDYRHYLPLPLMALCIANSSDATEILMLSYLLANPKFRQDMFGDNGSNSSSMEGAEYLAASIFLGMLLGGILFGFISDQIGRRPALFAGLLINATAGLFSSFSFLTPTFVQLTMWRFLAGIGIGATVPSLFSLASEWAPKEVRGAVVTAVASFWMVGSLLVSGLAWILFQNNLEYVSQDDDQKCIPMWRIFAALCAMPSAFGAWMVYLYVPESPRFLASSKKNYEQSAKVCNEMAGFLGINLTNKADEGEISGQSGLNRVNKALIIEKARNNLNNSMYPAALHVIMPLTGDELRRDYASLQNGDGCIKTDTTSTLTAQLFRIFDTPLKTLQKIYSPQLLSRTTVPLQLLWFSLSFGTYGITTWINTLFVEIHLQNMYFNSFLFALANLPGNIMSILYSDRWGRKRMLVGSLIGAAGGLLGFAVLVYAGDEVASSNSQTYGIVMFSCVFQIFSIISWNAIDILTGELFPTCIRSAGMGVCTASGRFGAMSAQFVNARLMMASGDEGVKASAWVLVSAASTLLLGASIPMFLEEDMTLGEVKDEIIDENNERKDCLSDDEDYQSLIKGRKDPLSDNEDYLSLI